MTATNIPDQFDFNSVGGVKTDVFPIADTSVYRSAGNENDTYCAVAMMSRVNTNGWIRFTTSATLPTLVSANTWDATWRKSTTTVPVFSRSSTGVYTITLPSSVLDELGNSHTLNLKYSFAKVEGSSFALAQTAITSANVITVYCGTVSGTPSDLSGSTNILIGFR